MTWLLLSLQVIESSLMLSVPALSLLNPKKTARSVLLILGYWWKSKTPPPVGNGLQGSLVSASE